MLISNLFEAKISSKFVGAAMAKVISYLEKTTGEKFRRLGVEHYKNSKNRGFGERFQLGDTLRCVRFNWAGKKSSEIESVDFWLGNQRDPNFNIVVKGTSFVKSLPGLAAIIKKPKLGKFKISALAGLNESAEQITEAKKGEFNAQTSVADMIQKLEAGRSFNRSEFIMAYHPENAFAYDEFVEANSEKLVIQGKRISLPKGEKFGGAKKGIAGADGELEVSNGGNGEEYEVEVPEDDRVSFSESIEHLEGLTTALIKGSFNALMVAGKGGTGKTQTVETALENAGLKDGAGYFKITGSASPIGIYTALYKYRDKIVLFDDCDGALDSQDGRNIIKAATDTKPQRKLVWGKKSSGMYDPDDESSPKAKDPKKPSSDMFGSEEEEEDMIDDRIPRHFIFTGRIIFISNLQINKLDPDGALRTRAFLIAINPTPEEIFQRMGEILDSVKLEGGLTMSHEDRVNVLNVVKSSRKKDDASLRTLVRALNLAASKAPNWERLVKLYC